MYEILLHGVQGESGTMHFSASFPQQKLRGGFAGEGKVGEAGAVAAVQHGLRITRSSSSALPALPASSGSAQTCPVPQPSRLRTSEELAVFSFLLFPLLSASPLLFYLFPFSKDI